VWLRVMFVRIFSFQPMHIRRRKPYSRLQFAPPGVGADPPPSDHATAEDAPTAGRSSLHRHCRCFVVVRMRRRHRSVSVRMRHRRGRPYSWPALLHLHAAMVNGRAVHGRDAAEEGEDVPVRRISPPVVAMLRGVRSMCGLLSSREPRGTSSLCHAPAGITGEMSSQLNLPQQTRD
jgi:hypothetical protein